MAADACGRPAPPDRTTILSPLAWTAVTVPGKRCTPADSNDLEVIVTRAGTCTLAVDATPLVLKEPRVLQSSD